MSPEKTDLIDFSPSEAKNSARLFRAAGRSNSITMRHLIDILDFSVEELQELIDTANDIIEHPGFYADRCRGKRRTPIRGRY